MGAKDEVGKIEYHYGFYGAVHVEYESSHVNMEYLQEHLLKIYQMIGIVQDVSKEKTNLIKHKEFGNF